MRTELSGDASPLFGEEFPYPLDGKFLLREIAESFAREFNREGRRAIADYGSERLAQWRDLRVTGAFPTSQQECPTISIIRLSCTSKFAGIGGEIESKKAPNGLSFQSFRGNTEVDSIQINICTLNERLRDDLHTWFKQYILDASRWLMPQLKTVFDFRILNSSDDQVEYQGMQGTPGFQFYVAQLTCQVSYDLLVLDNVDILKSIINWQSIG